VGGDSLFDRKAIVIAANPYEYKEIGDVELHRQHRDRYGGVFWDLIPPGRWDTPWRHPEIGSGYFYISREGMVKYRMNIEYVKQWKEIVLQGVRDYIPESRRSYLESNPKTLIYYAILIRELEPLKTSRRLKEFTLVSSGKPVEAVRNYVIVYDQGYQ